MCPATTTVSLVRTVLCVQRSTHGPCEGSPCVCAQLAGKEDWVGKHRLLQEDNTYSTPHRTGLVGSMTMPVCSSKCLHQHQPLTGTWSILNGTASQSLMLHFLSQTTPRPPDSFTGKEGIALKMPWGYIPGRPTPTCPIFKTGEVCGRTPHFTRRHNQIACLRPFSNTPQERHQVCISGPSPC